MSKPCPFCGSENRVIDTPYLDAFGEKETTWCCVASKRNAKFIEKAYDPDNKPDIEEIEKW